MSTPPCFQTSIEECVRVTKLQPGDVLLIHLPASATAAQIQDIQAKVARFQIPCVVLAADVKAELYRPPATPTN